MAKNQKLKGRLNSAKGKIKNNKKGSIAKNLSKKQKKVKNVSKKEVKIDTVKVSSALKEKTKKVFNSNEKQKKTKKQEKVGFSISQADESKLREFEEYFDRKSMVDLKSILKKNNQVCSGTKSDLVQRCSQGKLFGGLPNCSLCFGGKLRFNIKTGEYYCPGFMNDTEFSFCKFRANDGIVRNPWQD